MIFGNRRAKSLTLLVVLLLVAKSRAQVERSTIPEQLARAGHSLVNFSTIPSGLPATMAAILSDTDLVVRGIVGEPQSYISADQLDVLTDYPIIRPLILYQGAQVTSPKPGLHAPAVTVTLLGGSVMVDGLTYNQKVYALPSLEPGTENLFLLKRQGAQYRIAGGHFGVFRISDAQLIPLTRKGGFAPEYRNVPVAQAAEELVARLRALRQ